MNGDLESSSKVRRLSSCSLERSFKMVMFNQWSLCLRKRPCYFKPLRTTLKMLNSEELEIDGSSEVPETTFPPFRFRSLREEEQSLLTPTRVSTLETLEPEKLESNNNLYSRIKGKTYLLEAHETLWEKHLPDTVEDLVKRAQSG